MADLSERILARLKETFAVCSFQGDAALCIPGGFVPDAEILAVLRSVLGHSVPGDSLAACPTHPETRLLCPRCIAGKGGARTAEKYGHDVLARWGRSGGRPKKKLKKKSPKKKRKSRKTKPE